MDKSIFKERLIYEKYKDRPIDDFERFKQKVKEKHGFEPSDELIRKLRIYQRKKSDSQPFREYNKFFYENTPKKRHEKSLSKREQREAKTILERLEEDGKRNN